MDIEKLKIELGELQNISLWRMNQPEIIRLMENLIAYALIRDEYREQLKARRNGRHSNS